MKMPEDCVMNKAPLTFNHVYLTDDQTTSKVSDGRNILTFGR